LAKYRNDLEYTVVIPTISVVVKPQDIFDAPDDLDVTGMVRVSESKLKGKGSTPESKESDSVAADSVNSDEGVTIVSAG
jgi:hypothetical protein